MHHYNTIPQRHYLVKIVRDYKYRSTRIARGDQLLLHECHGTDV
jgi:hypothetical protein